MPPTKDKSTKTSLAKKWIRMEETELQQAIVDDCLPRYPENEPPKLVQVDAVANLVKGRHTFVMAGTGCGKSRISEMYYNLFAKTKKAVILVLNPLDALGDNQVKEKVAQNYTAVNLKNQNFTQEVAIDIQKGKYNFVYLSPEVFLNNEMFSGIYHDSAFQDRLALIVVDEAHMLYSWGLVANKEAKKSSAHKRHQDRAVFRPSYGDLGRQMMATENTPVLLLSATCRPIAITEILKSLKIPEDNIHFSHAELTRPELRILRFPMESSLKSANDLLDMFGRKEEVNSKEMVPTLIYSGTRNATFRVMKVVNDAHGTPGEENNPVSLLIRRYHASTGNMDKDDTISGYELADFPCISSTMALGLGQNWKRVRRVIHMGRGDPSCINQMIGRCGRDGKPGLAILFVEPKRKFGLNTPEAISKADKQENDTRMDSLAITPVCLRIAFSIDNKHGYIPMDRDDLNYLHEECREVDEGFAPCKCSNCAPEEAVLLKARMKQMNNNNFDAILENPKDVPGPLPVKSPKVKRSRVTKPKEKKLRPIELLVLNRLVECFNCFFIQTYGRPQSFLPEEIFGRTEANAIARKLDEVKTIDDIAKLIGGEQLDGELDMLQKTLEEFRRGPEYQAYLEEQEEYSKHIDNEMERLKNVKRKLPPKESVPAQVENLPKQTRPNRKIAGLPGSEASMPEDRGVMPVTVRAGKPRASASEVAENKRLRAEKKKKKEEEEAKRKSDSQKKWEADKIVLEEIKNSYADKRARCS
ncbi:ATP-dependent DNA helicase sgs1 [Puccinia graminis f. sp. tritici]|uniref:DNA 3'-5' helicase n=1 Tax=Puccinia graminis f. sp. tritici TaxID=56615 RepID=A0A5B0PDE7_PUCGR|nr:ATP-dependent DNA helicase sgs1 [Puccinia graminis f. sp. tritici]